MRSSRKRSSGDIQDLRGAGDSSRWALVFVFGFLSALVLIAIIKPPVHQGSINSSPWRLIPPEIEDRSSSEVLDDSESFFTLDNHDKTEEEKDDSEALKSLDVALILKGKRKFDKSLKVFQHALALNPRHPRILNHYGEFIEDIQKDVLQADLYFARALSYSKSENEDYTRALENRRRTSLIVEEIDRQVLNRIEEKKRAFQILEEQNGAALRRAKTEAYYQHIYHTVGIEGNTMSLAQTRTLLETRLAIGGKSIMEHNEVLGLDAALKYINQTLVDKLGEITIQDILEIHRRVIGYVDPIEAGMFRRSQVYIGDHIPPPPSQIDALMSNFIKWLNAPSTLELHPIQLAAIAHYKLVYIHPFIDGNGRTSRLLMNLILMVAGYPPVIIRRQDRLTYYRTLVDANHGDVRPFLRFIAKSTERTLDAFYYSASERKISSFGGRISEDEKDISLLEDVQNHLDIQDKIILGGSIGPNMTVET